jgi:D-serine dehydratase
MMSHQNTVLDSHYKSFPVAAEPCPIKDIGQRRWNLYRNDLAYPIAVLKQAELDHNLRWMQAYAKQHGIQIAPHGKTTMSPQLFRRQLELGAWGLTFATIFQAQVGVASGARRIIIANQVVSGTDLDSLAHLLASTPDLRVWFLVDSQAQVALIEDWATRRDSKTVFDCLLEIGMNGQRTGCRSTEQAIALAQRIHGSGNLRLGGIECYEGGLARCQSEHDRAEVQKLMRLVDDTARQCDGLQLFDGDQILISAGGSAVFDLVVPGLTPVLSRPATGILRSGCYVTHDHDFYAKMLHNVQEREHLQDSLRPALEVWTMVQSVPEPGLAMLSCGRRDISFDASLPVPVGHAPIDATKRQAAPGSWTISALNDQHAYMRFDPDEGKAPSVGDRVILGISHPCTTFDKWSWMPVIDETGNVVSAVTTRF